ncbi:MAG: 3-hydroxyacyl-ACP dehydratase FabZ family protein [Opitutales bacterium]
MQITDLIPHRPPFLFVDEIIEADADHLLARRTWRADEVFYAGHYPGNPITPGVLLCEATFQAAAAFLASRGDEFGGKTPVLSRIQDARFKRMVKPGDTVDIEVRLKETLKGFHFLTGTVKADGKVVVRLDFALALVDE